MQIEILVAKVVFAAIFAIILIEVVAPSIGIIGIMTCPGCNPVVNAFTFIVVPMAAAFIGVQKIINIFTASRG